MTREKASLSAALALWLLSAGLAATAVWLSFSTAATSIHGLSIPSPAQALIISAGALSFATVGA